MDKNLVISVKALVIFLVILLSLYTAYLLMDVLVILILALVIVMGMERPIGKLTKIKIHRSAATLIVYTLLIAFFVVAISVVIPPLTEQSKGLFNNLGGVYSTLTGQSIKELSIYTLFENVDLGTGLTTTLSLFGNVASVLSVVIIAIYMSLDWPNLKSRLFSLFPKVMYKGIENTTKEIETNIGHWVVGQVILMVVVGVASYVGLLLIGIKEPLALGIIAGVLEIVPLLGPVLAGILAGLIGLSQSPTHAIMAVALFVIIQQLENNLLVPNIMHKVSGFSSLAILLAIMIGSSVFGVVGAVMAIPIMMVAVILLRNFLKFQVPEV